MDLLDSIVEKIQNTYNGCLDCEEQKADLYVYLDGQETSIKKITTTEIIYDNDGFLTMKLIDTDVHTLAYIDRFI